MLKTKIQKYKHTHSTQTHAKLSRMGSSKLSEHKFKLACLGLTIRTIGNGEIIHEFK